MHSIDTSKFNESLTSSENISTLSTIYRLRWDYLTKSWWNMTEMAGDRLKAFQWIQQHGATLGQVGRVRDA